MPRRLCAESLHRGRDPVLDRAAETLDAIAGPIEVGRQRPPGVIARCRVCGTVLSFFSTIAPFGSAEDTNVARLNIQAMFPANNATRATLLPIPAPPPQDSGAADAKSCAVSVEIGIGPGRKSWPSICAAGMIVTANIAVAPRRAHDIDRTQMTFAHSHPISTVRDICSTKVRRWVLN